MLILISWVLFKSSSYSFTCKKIKFNLQSTKVWTAWISSLTLKYTCIYKHTGLPQPPLSGNSTEFTQWKFHSIHILEFSPPPEWHAFADEENICWIFFYICIWFGSRQDCHHWQTHRCILLDHFYHCWSVTDHKILY